MRSDVDDFELVTARTVGEACARVAEGYRPLAGGTDVMVLLSAGKLAHRRWVDVSRVDELHSVDVRDATIDLGALVTYSEVRRHPVVSRELPMLAQAASETGGVAIQNRGTLGGNIGNASPAADSPPALLAYDARLVLVSSRGSREVEYASFHTGYKRTAAAPDELVGRVVIPRVPDRIVHYYHKVGPRRAQAISKVCFAACARAAPGESAAVRVRVAIGGVAPVPLRVVEVEQAVEAGDAHGASQALARAIAPIDDVRSTARYRRRVADNLLRDFLQHVALAT